MRIAQAQMAQQTQMQREGSQMDMNGQPRPQTPGSGDAPSPKRQRMEGGQFNGQMGPMGRGQNPGMPGAQGMPNPAGMPQGSPAVDQNGEMFNGNALRNMPQPGGSNSNHALQDYQMQLMLLEQQNKKRLLMARQEQDSQTGPAPMPGQPGFGALAMSPSGSRTGPSPNPDDQMKRGTPKMNPGGMPQGGMDGMQGRASPAPGFDPNQMNPAMNPNFQGMKMPNMMGPNAQMIAAATSHPAFNPAMNGQMTPQQMEMLRQQAVARSQNGPWPQGPPPGMMHGQPQQAPNMTPQQRNTAMPPPPAPATGDNQNKTQPSSPQQNAAPPTPSQTNKPNPKKKEPAKNNKVRENRKDFLCYRSNAPFRKLLRRKTRQPPQRLQPQRQGISHLRLHPLLPSLLRLRRNNSPKADLGPTHKPLWQACQAIQLHSPTWVLDRSEGLSMVQM